MSTHCRSAAAATVVFLGALTMGASGLIAQPSPSPAETSSSVRLDEADVQVRHQLERIRRQLAEKQWDEAVESLRQMTETSGGKMIAITPRRYVTVAEYCHREIAATPPEALRLYRRRVDPLARSWLDEGIARRDVARLEAVVGQFFGSSVGDDALWALGEIALEEGRHAAARGYWERILPRAPDVVPANKFDAALADASPDDRKLVGHWYRRVDAAGDSRVWRLRRDEYLSDGTARELASFWQARGVMLARLAYPDSNLDAARTRAGLILVSIRELALDRARAELEAFSHLHPGAEGVLEGRKAPYAERLSALIEQAVKWLPLKPVTDWLTFAGAFDRNGVAPRSVDLGAPAWRPIPIDANFHGGFAARPVIGNLRRELSCYPLVYGDLLLFNTQSHVFAFNVQSGKPAWPREERQPGEIFEFPPSLSLRLARGVGSPRFTMTAQDGKLYALLGTQITSRSVESIAQPSALVCLDLARQGMLRWQIAPDEERWAFEGAPIVDGANLYIAMRKNDVRPLASVAAFDIGVAPPRMRWRTMVASAETPGGGQVEEASHNLLTYHDGMLYFNTNLGAVAALRARDGQTQWAALYPRARRAVSEGQGGRGAFHRDLNPCVYHRGVVFAAPADGDSLLALDAATGELAWESPLSEDVAHLLGVGEDCLLASGNSLWWFDIASGRARARASAESPRGFGRGVLAGDKVYWPTQQFLYVFQQKIEHDGAPKLARQPIPLTELRGATGGNLVVAGDKLIIASTDQIFAIKETSGQPLAAGKETRPSARTLNKTPAPQPQSQDPNARKP